MDIVILTSFLGRIVFGVDAHIDNHSARLQPAALHKLSLTYCSYNDISTTYNIFHVLST